MDDKAHLCQIRLGMRLVRLGWLYKASYVIGGEGLIDRWFTLQEDVEPRLELPGLISGDAVRLLRNVARSLPEPPRAK